MCFLKLVSLSSKCWNFYSFKTYNYFAIYKLEMNSQFFVFHTYRMYRFCVSLSNLSFYVCWVFTVLWSIKDVYTFRIFNEINKIPKTIDLYSKNSILSQKKFLVVWHLILDFYGVSIEFHRIFEILIFDFIFGENVHFLITYTSQHLFSRFIFLRICQ